jgi:hypothetical protein
MPVLTRVFVIHKTANKEDANSDANFQLQLARPGGDVILSFPDQPQDERERGSTDLYEFDLSNEPQVNTDDPGFDVSMINQSDDGWLPQSIFVLAETTEGKTIVLGAHPTWGNTWFDTDGSPNSGPKHSIGGAP